MTKRFPNVFVNKKKWNCGKIWESYGIVTCYQINKDGIDVLVLWIALCSANCMLWSQLVSGITYVVQLLSERYKDIHWAETRLFCVCAVWTELLRFCGTRVFQGFRCTAVYQLHRYAGWSEASLSSDFTVCIPWNGNIPCFQIVSICSLHYKEIGTAPPWLVLVLPWLKNSDILWQC